MWQLKKIDVAIDIINIRLLIQKCNNNSKNRYLGGYRTS